jgi:hypothetical protein
MPSDNNNKGPMQQAEAPMAASAATNKERFDFGESDILITV